MKTNVYIDGFNFYYGCYKNYKDPLVRPTRRCKWLNFRSLLEAVFPNDDIRRIHYCTARVSATPNDPDMPLRQQTYLRALGTVGIEPHFGHFETREKRGVLKTRLPCPILPVCVLGLVKVETREEKGSDVHLVSHLLRDAFLGDFEQAIVISNDSDIEPAIEIVVKDAKLPVHVLSPYPFVVNRLRQAATSSSILDKTLMPNHLLPSAITLPDGTVLTKPNKW